MDSNRTTDAPEEWRSLAPIGASMYEVSSRGRIRSLRHMSDGQPLVMSLTLTKGYLQTRVTMDDGRKKTIFAHRALCEIWHGPCPSSNHVAAHRRDVRVLNSPDEVFWATRSENARMAFENGAHIIRRGYVRGYRGDLTAAQVRAIRVRAENGESTRTIAHELGISYARAYRAATGLQYRSIKASPVEQERDRIKRRAELDAKRAARRAVHDALTLEGLELAAAPEGQRRKRAPHTPPTGAPRSRGSK